MQYLSTHHENLANHVGSNFAWSGLCYAGYCLLEDNGQLSEAGKEAKNRAEAQFAIDSIAFFALGVTELLARLHEPAPTDTEH